MSSIKHINDYLEKPDIDRILDAAKVYNYRDWLIIQMLWRGGMRASELLGITPAAIEWQKNVVNIINGKGGKDRRIYLHTETMQLLRQYVAENNIKDDMPIFNIKRRQLYNICKNYGEMAGIHNVHPHIFRHSYSINLIRQGCDVRRLQLSLGHAGIQSTSVYLKFNDEDIKEVYDQAIF